MKPNLTEPGPTHDLLALPKVELHVHLEGFVDLDFWRQMTQAQSSWDERRDQAMKAHFGFVDFAAFLKCFGAVIFSFLGADDLYRLAKKAASQLKDQGVCYAEVMFSPSFFVNQGLDFAEILSEIKRGFTEVQAGPELKLIFDGPRNFGLDAVWQTFKLAAADRTGLVIGVGLGGDEVNFPARDFQAPFDWAKAEGFRRTCHAGEAAGESSIKEAITLLGAERIGHGLGITPGGEVERLVLSNNIGLDLCPHSNCTTGVLATLEEHPLADYLSRGFAVSLNSDDPGFFQTNLLKEYHWAQSQLTWKQISQICEYSISQSFMAEPQKSQLRAKLHLACQPGVAP